MVQHLKPHSAEVTLFQGDDMSRLAELRRSVDIAERRLAQAERSAEEQSTVRRIGDDTSGQVHAAETALEEAKQEYNGFVDDAADRALTIELQSIGRRKFKDLLAAHPPRLKQTEPDSNGKSETVEHEDDEGWGVNTDAFGHALLTFHDGTRATIARPVFESKADVTEFVDYELDEGDFDQLWKAAFYLNRMPSIDPKAVRYTTASLSSVET